MTDKRIKRIAKGKRPVYFADPATDKLMGIVLALVEELSVTRDRLDALERSLEQGGQLDREALNRFVPEGDAAAERESSREAYIERVMRIVTLQLQRPDDSGATESFTSTLQEMMAADD